MMNDSHERTSKILLRGYILGRCYSIKDEEIEEKKRSCNAKLKIKSINYRDIVINISFLLELLGQRVQLAQKYLLQHIQVEAKVQLIGASR
jgi:hypothetical protein